MQVWDRFRVPILLITHDDADVAAIGRQVIRIDDGRIVGPAQTLHVVPPEAVRSPRAN